MNGKPILRLLTEEDQRATIQSFLYLARKSIERLYANNNYNKPYSFELYGVGER